MINVPSLWYYITCSFQSFRHSFTVSSEEYSSPPFVSGDIFSQTTKARLKVQVSHMSVGNFGNISDKQS